MFGPACGICTLTLTLLRRRGRCGSRSFRRRGAPSPAPVPGGAPWSSTRKRDGLRSARRCRSAARSISTTRRSRSFLWPVISACTGAAKAERRGVGRDVVHAPVGDEDRAGHAVVRHVGERRGQRREQPRAVGLAVRLAGLDEAHLDARHASEPLGELRAHRLGLLRDGRRIPGSGSCRRRRRRPRSAGRGPRA